MTTEHYLPVSLHMNSNDLSKKAFFNYFLTLITRQIVDGFNTQTYHLFTSETATLPDITILYARGNLQKNEIEKGTLLNQFCYLHLHLVWALGMQSVFQRSVSHSTTVEKRIKFRTNLFL